MNSRERVRKAIRFEEPDRVPIDLGGNTLLTSICAGAYNDLKKHLGLADLRTEIWQIGLMTIKVSEPIRQRLGVDVVPITPPIDMYGFDMTRWRSWNLPWDGSEVFTAANAAFRANDSGDTTLYFDGQWEISPKFIMPRGCHYFEIPPMGPDFLDQITLAPVKPDIAGLRAKISEPPYSDALFEYLREETRHYHEETDYALMVDGFNTYVPSGEALAWLTNTIILMRQEPDLVHEWFDIAADISISRTRRLLDMIEDRCDIIVATCGDFGNQQSEFIPPDLFAKFYVPMYRKVYSYIHRTSDMKIFHHSCGSIARLLPHFIDAGLDIINPVQTMAHNMEAESLMARFGGKIVFWGGGVDVQNVLPFGSAEEVRRDVAQRVKTFMPGGGYVFNPIHNVQDGVPPENIVAAFDAAREAGTYPSLLS